MMHRLLSVILVLCSSLLPLHTPAASPPPPERVLVTDVADTGQPESLPSMAGRFMTMVLAPKK